MKLLPFSFSLVLLTITGGVFSTPVDDKGLHIAGPAKLLAQNGNFRQLVF